MQMPPRPRGLSKRDQQVRVTVGANIRRAREARGVTLEILAEAIEVSVSTMGRIELGQQVISTDILQRIAIALGTSTSSLAKTSKLEAASA